MRRLRSRHWCLDLVLVRADLSGRAKGMETHTDILRVKCVSDYFVLTGILVAGVLIPTGARTIILLRHRPHDYI